MPKSRVEFCKKKFEANVKRDCVVREELQVRGIKCLVVWECTVKKMKKDQKKCKEYLEIVEKFLKDSNMFLELT